MAAPVELTRPAPHVALLRLARPERLNAINGAMVEALEQAFAAIAADHDVHAVVLTGAGRGFCAGLDVRDFGPGAPAEGAPESEMLLFQERMAGLPLALHALPQPVIAAVNGPCVGGGFALALAADLRLCSPLASFANGAILLGLTGGEMGMSYHLPRIVGVTVAADWMMTGRTVGAEEADRRGLVNEVVAPDELEARALAIAEHIASLAPMGVRLTKTALQANVDAPDLTTAMALENRNQVTTSATPEAAERRAAWRAR
ncbi:MAG TPA: enoyl-CoA hydratase/isomerase family protein [Mycobacteriales bacterium]|nr:enoyl-CoA hydratase/isomerase family protein [Mycobacteriales bacterium]